MKKVAYILALVVIAVVLVGCTSAPAGDNANPIVQPNEPAAADDTPAADTADAEDQSSEATALKGIFDRQVAFKADYDIKTTAEGMTTTSSMMQYVKTPKMRVDMTATGMEIRSYVVGDTTTMCTNIQNTWSCQATTVTPTADSEAADAVKNDPTKYTVHRIAGRTIAGAATDCYAIDNVNGYDMEYCFTSEGASLYTKITGAEMMSEIVATSYSTSVSDADFVPPSG